jgi:hypothetical protein
VYDNALAVHEPRLKVCFLDVEKKSYSIS